MEYELILSENARFGLLEILDYYIKNHSLERTEKVEQSIHSALDRITLRPLSNKIYENLNYPHNKLRRAVVYKTHIIVYEIVETKIMVIDIYDGRRNPEDFKY